MARELPEFLSPAEVRALSGGATTLAEQMRVLNTEGVPARLVGRRIVVSRYHAREWLAGRHVTTMPEPVAPRLNAGLANYHAARRREGAIGEVWLAQAARDWAAGTAERSRASANAATARRRAARIHRTPPWANRCAMAALYLEARRLTIETGMLHHVDHEIPLRGRLVSGLHVETNLRVMVGAENVRKSNRFTP